MAVRRTTGTGLLGRNSERSVYLDALRAFALARVVLYHSTNLWTVTAFTAMPLMFFIAGSLYAGSVDRRPTRQVVVDRFRRILFPYWIYILAMVALWGYLGVLGEVNPLSWVSFVMPLLSFGGPIGPGDANSDIVFTWIALWYLQMHLLLSLVGGWMRRMQLTHSRRYWTVLVALTIVLMPIGLGGTPFWAVCWSLGYLHHDGVLERWLKKLAALPGDRTISRWALIAAATGPVGALLFFAFHETGSLESLAGLGSFLLGAFWLVSAVGLRERIEPRLEVPAVRATVTFISARALTIYLWHMVAVWAVMTYAFPGNLAAPARFAWTVLLLVPACVLFGWAEDLAARRRPTLWPRAAVRLPRTTPVDVRNPEPRAHRLGSSDVHRAG